MGFRGTLRVVRRSRREADGFTIIELLIVVVILGILTAAGVSKYQSIAELGRQKSCISNLGMIDHAVATWCAQNTPFSDTRLTAIRFDTFGRFLSNGYYNNYGGATTPPFTGAEIGNMIVDRKAWVCPKFMQRNNYVALAEVPASFSPALLYCGKDFQYFCGPCAMGCYMFANRAAGAPRDDDFPVSLYSIPNDDKVSISFTLCMDSGTYYRFNSGVDKCPMDLGVKYRHSTW
jgi:prepilin-type N-terminal cleavage/methylation domain-containing protein